MKWQQFLYAQRCALLALFFPACTFDKMVPTIPIQLDRFEAGIGEKETSLEALDELLRTHPDASTIQDAIHILRARAFSKQDAPEQAIAAWWSALETAQKGFGRIAFRGLVLAVANSTKELQTPDAIKEWLEAASKKQKTGPYLEKLLSDGSSLKKQIKSILAQGSDPSDQVQMPLVSPPSEKSVPQNDLLLAQTAEAYCSRTAHENQAAWQTWEKTLPPPLRSYWQAISSFCNKDVENELKVEKSLHAVATLKDYPEHGVYQLKVLQNLTSLYRQNGMRQQLIQTYLAIGEQWESPMLDHIRMGMPLERFYKEKIADLLWAARYAAMGESYDRAEGFALAASEQASLAIKTLPKLSFATRKELLDAIAESYLIRTTRIAVEQKTYKKGLELLAEAKKIEGTSNTTADNILWNQGLLAFLDDDWKQSEANWEELLSRLQAEKRQTYLQLRTHFWLSKAAVHLNKERKAAKHIQAIHEKDPFSFYGVLTMDASSLNRFGNLKQMEESISKKQAYRISRLQDNQILAYWLKKAELLLSLGISPSLSKIALQEMVTVMASTKERFEASERSEDIYLYLTRLAALSGDFSKSIFYTTAISQSTDDFWKSHPEQLRVYFPFAYTQDFEKAADQTSFLPHAMLSIARQESSFREDATSPAGAIGLMQLMPQTAQRHANLLGKTEDEIAQTLKDASLNISIAAQYLQTLALRYGSNEPAIYAAYNAGEFAVDQWLKKRHHDDPILWVEMIPFGETKEYVQKVWRNRIVYDFLTTSK